MRPHLSVNKRNHLTIGQADTIELAAEFGTPLYVVDEDRIRARYREFYDAFASAYPKVEVRYAYKANSSLAVLHILRQEGAGADVLSAGEIYLATHVGLSPEKIIFTGNNKTDEELELALEKGITINFDSLHEMERLNRICSAREKKALVSFRINPAVSPETHPHLATGLRESKFGIPAENALEAYTKAKESEYFEVKGIHMHIGSQITSTSPYVEAVTKLMDIAGELKKIGVELDFVDFGGGVGIRYEEDKPFITPGDLADALLPLVESKIEEHGLEMPSLYFEPGRYIVGDAAILLARVSTIKHTPYKKFVGVDAGFHVLLRPSFYGAYHEAVVANKAGDKGEERVDIAGNVCESVDILARDRVLPKIEGGDLIAFLDTGAYGIIMSSRYNSRPLPAEVLVSHGEYELIRERETYEDLIRGQHVPRRIR
jgi:diaminopimelate decarboxylase